MKHIKSRWIIRAGSLLLAASLINGNAADKKEKEQPQPKQNPGNQNRANPAPGNQGQGNRAQPNPVQANPSQGNPNRTGAGVGNQGQGNQGQANPNRGNQDQGVRGQGNPAQVNQGQRNQGPGEVNRGNQGQGTVNRGNNPDVGERGQKNQGQGQTSGKGPAEPNRGNQNQGKDQGNRGQGNTAPGNAGQGNQNQGRGNQGQGNSIGARTEGGRSGGTTAGPAVPRPQLTEVKKANGETQRLAPSGKPREVTKVDQKSGVTETRQITASGRVAREEVVKRDGTRQTKELDLGNREKKVTVVHPDKKIDTTDVHYDRTGKVRARETVTTDARGTVVSRNVVVRQNLVIKNTTVINVNRTVVRDYRPCRWGYVYHPVIIAPVVFATYYDPYWYGPTRHRFTYSWGWNSDPWYRHHAYYWEPYPVYAGPSYWVTDWMVAGYVADRYAVATSIEQTREEVRLAKEEAAKARAAAEQAQDAAERAEAIADKERAEARAERAEARALKAELAEARRKELGDKPNPNARPIDKETKDALKDQVEQTIAEKKEFAEQSAKGGNLVSPDVSAALKDPKHIYPVSKTISVIRAEDSKPAGTLTAGDLLKVEPGQDSTLKDADDSTLVNMRVITSKGEDDSVAAGTVISVPLKELQEFDNEFRAKIDLGLEEADKNKELFKKGAEAK